MDSPARDANKRIKIQFKRAADFIKKLDTKAPLELSVKEFFRKHKEMGSKDRRLFQDILYRFLRSSNLFQGNITEENIALAHWIASNESTDIVADYFPSADWSAIDLPTKKERLKKLFELGIIPEYHLYPHKTTAEYLQLQGGFADAFFTQKKVWIRPKKEVIVHILRALDNLQISYEVVENAIGLEKPLDLDQLPGSSKGWVEVQDLAAQRVGEWLEPHPEEKWLDACSGSGGKSLLLLDILPVELYATDVRESTLRSYRARVMQSGFESKATVHDFTQSPLGGKLNYFDAAIADVPCTGSGTWGRNPLGLMTFKEADLEMYSARQEKILANVIENVKPGGLIHYVTCSVFEEENEQVLEKSLNRGVEILRSRILCEWERGGDALFHAVLKKK